MDLRGLYIHTVGAAIPFLLPDLVKELCKDTPCDVHLGDIPDAAPDSELAAYLGLGGRPHILLPGESPGASLDTFSVLTKGGKKLWKVIEYVDRAISWNVGAVLAPFDGIPVTAGKNRVRKSVGRSLSYLDIALARVKDSGSAMQVFAALVGGGSSRAREACKLDLRKRKVAGYVVAGLSCDLEVRHWAELLAASVDELPPATVCLPGPVPPERVCWAVSLGVTTFDSAYALKCAEENAALYCQWPEAAGRLDVSSPELQEDCGPLREGCECYTCRHHSRAYLYHLHSTKEMLGKILLYVHNLAQYTAFLAAVLKSKEEGLFADMWKAFQRA